MRELDLSRWPRKEVFDFFQQMDHPQYHLTMELDITHFRAYLKKTGLNFHYAMNFFAADAMDAVENIRLRIRGDKVVLHDKIHVSLIDPMGEDLFKMVLVERSGSLADFCREAKERSLAQQCFLNLEDEARDDLIYTTSLPWISFTELGHGFSLDREDSVPRISWGKFFSREGKILLPFSVQVHHALVDGIHIGRYLTALQDALNRL